MSRSRTFDEYEEEESQNERQEKRSESWESGWDEEEDWDLGASAAETDEIIRLRRELQDWDELE